MCTFTLESTHFIFNKCPIYTHDGASSKFSTNSHETDYSVGQFITPPVILFNGLDFLPYFSFISKSYASVSSLSEAEFMNIQFR
jgi:hypothetical protein